ncbi:hypothetical protein [Pseudonocardia humida]|uniref:UTRA domain-containing protein n=1 Tax=Pseudonocardia humida TaxID=2800819 RepID=A0ABT1A7A9_9PSEU|nr:hypothetical protein [Pseudonocardia humida]MCO1658609.1 hypothetical protein [Pseudonocardia humida]
MWRDRLDPGEIVEVDGVRTTSPLRTAFDLARRGELEDRVVAVDALANAHRSAPDPLLNFAAWYRGARGNAGVAAALAYADARAGSPVGTRLRLVVVRAGLPVPEVRWVVQDERARTAVWLASPTPRTGSASSTTVRCTPTRLRCCGTSDGTPRCSTRGGESSGTPSTTSCTARS